MKIKEMYEYLYYKIYKAMDHEIFPWWAETRTSAFLLFLEVVFFFSVIFYLKLIYPSWNPPEGYMWALIPFGVLFVIDYFTFHSHNQWKIIIHKYDEWPNKKNFKGTIIVWLLIGLIIINFAFAIYMTEKVISI